MFYVFIFIHLFILLVSLSDLCFCPVIHIIFIHTFVYTDARRKREFGQRGTEGGGGSSSVWAADPPHQN